MKVEDLGVRTKKFALRIIRLKSEMPPGDSARILGNQALRSGTSIGANYREARRARSRAEFVAKLGECLKEADETQYWLELIDEGNILPHDRLTSILDEVDQLIAIFVASTNTTKSRSI